MSDSQSNPSDKMPPRIKLNFDAESVANEKKDAAPKLKLGMSEELINAAVNASPKGAQAKGAEGEPDTPSRKGLPKVESAEPVSKPDVDAKVKSDESSERETVVDAPVPPPSKPQTPKASKPTVIEAEDDLKPVSQAVKDASKNQTMRIDGDDIFSNPEEDHQQAAKNQTMRIDNIEGDSLEDLYKEALGATQRVVLVDKHQKLKESAKLSDLDEGDLLEKAEKAELQKKSSARIDLQEMLSDEDQNELMKEQTMAIRLDDEPMDASSAGTVKLKRPPASADSTMQISAPSDQTMNIAPATEETAKGETARIELPPEAATSGPPTQRKTIRIKRPDAGGGSGTPKTMAIARPPAGGGRKTLSIAKKTAAPSAEVGSGEAAEDLVQFDSDEESVHPFFAIAAVIAMLIGLAVVYVLAATMTPGVPFPGRLV